MGKKKLLVTASTFPRWEGDTEPRFVLDLCKYLTEWFDVTVLVPGAPEANEKEVLEGVRVIRYHYFPIHKWETLCYPGAIVPRIKEKRIRILLVPFLFFALYFQLLRRLKNYDMVHAHWLIPQGIVQSFFRKPYIVTGHGGDVTSLNAGMIKKLKMRCLKRARHVTVVSEDLRARIEKLVPGLKTSVISMGVDMSGFGRQYAVDNYFGQDGKKVVLFVGRLAEKKGVAYLIEAMKKIDAVLVIAGDGPLKDSLMKQAESQADKIRFVGAQTHDRLREMYASADVFAAPFITADDGDKEGLSVVVLEALASGLPIVACGVGGVGELLRDRETALLCEEKNVEELADAICEVLHDGDLGSRLIANGAELIKRYDYKAIAARYAGVMGENTFG